MPRKGTPGYKAAVAFMHQHECSWPVALHAISANQRHAHGSTTAEAQPSNHSTKKKKQQKQTAQSKLHPLSPVRPTVRRRSRSLTEGGDNEKANAHDEHGQWQRPPAPPMQEMYEGIHDSFLTHMNKLYPGVVSSSGGSSSSAPGRFTLEDIEHELQEAHERVKSLQTERKNASTLNKTRLASWKVDVEFWTSKVSQLTEVVALLQRIDDETRRAQTLMMALDAAQKQRETTGFTGWTGGHRRSAQEIKANQAWNPRDDNDGGDEDEDQDEDAAKSADQLRQMSIAFLHNKA